MKFREATKNLAVVLIVGLAANPKARANDTRDFLVSCSYGVLAGTLVGAASLAFSDKPGESLNRVARGASIGLYAGILLGLYVVSGGPSDDDETLHLLGKSQEMPRWALAPVVNERGLDGFAAHVRVLEF